MGTVVEFKDDGDAVTIRLRDGRDIKITFDDFGEEGVLPEICILLPQRMVANCWKENFVKAEPVSAESHNALLCVQIAIPVENPV
jgi:hypothetical protein